MYSITHSLKKKVRELSFEKGINKDLAARVATKASEKPLWGGNSESLNTIQRPLFLPP